MEKLFLYFPLKSFIRFENSIYTLLNVIDLKVPQSAAYEKLKFL